MRRVTVTCLMILLLLGCAGQYYQNLPEELVPLAKYDEALTTYVSVKTAFVSATVAEQDAEVRARMLDIAYPLFSKVKVALDAWEMVLDAGEDPTAKIRAYQALWLELVNTLLQMGIVEVR